MKKLISLVLASTMVLSLLVGCGSNSSTSSTSSEDTSATSTVAPATVKEVKLTYITQQKVYNDPTKINESLAKMYPGLSVEASHIADNYETVIKTKFAAGDPPDLFDWNGYMANKTFAEAGYFLDITDDKIADAVMDQYKAAGMYNGKVYGIPSKVDITGLIYNKAAFEKAGIKEPPKTLTELKAAAESLKKVGITPFATGFKDVWVANQASWNIIGNNLGDLNTWYNDMMAGKGSFRNDKTYKALSDLIDLELAYTVDKPLSSDAASMANMLATGKAGMCYQGAWQYPEYIKSEPNPQVGLAPFPTSENPQDAIMLSSAQGVCFAAATGKHTEEAKNFFKWFVSKDGVEVIANLNKQASPIKVDVKVELNSIAADGDKFVKAGGKTTDLPKIYWPSGMTTEIGKNLQNYITKTITKDEFFNATDAAFKKLAGVN